MSKEQARCLRFECVWHGTELSADAPMCDYAFCIACTLSRMMHRRDCATRQSERARPPTIVRFISPATASQSPRASTDEAEKRLHD